MVGKFSVNLIAIALLALLFVSTAAAQTPTTVEVVLSASEVSMGDTVTADVFVRNAENIAGADVGIEVTESCLRIVSRENGDYLPTDSEAGGFSPFEEVTDISARFAASITDRSRIRSSDGVLFSVTLEAICETGVADIQVNFAQLAQLAGGDNQLSSLTLANGRVVATDATLNIIAGQASSSPATQTDGTAPNSPDEDDNLLFTLLIGMGGLLLIAMIFIAFLLGRLSSKAKVPASAQHRRSRGR